MKQFRDGKPEGRPFKRLTHAASIASMVFVAGCAGMEANKHYAGAMADGSFAPSRPAAANYGPDATRTCSTGGANPVLALELESWAKENGKPIPQPDGRLCAAADTFLGWE